MALRVLHTSDWHLGHALHGFERGYEHERVVAWLLDTVEAERIDAVLVAGDVFDAASPPVEAQQLWYRFLTEAWRRVPHLQVLVIGGNHDSPARLDATAPFLRALTRLHVLGGVPRAGGAPQLEGLVLPLRDRAGVVQAWVAAVPFLRAADTGAGLEDAVAEATRKVFAAALDLARSRREEGQALLAMGHLYVVGGQLSERSERHLYAGHQSAVPDLLFPPDVAYAALGHLHLAQAVGGRQAVRYSGSPLPLSFTERDYPHGAVVVALEGARAIEIRPVRAPRVVELLRVPEAGPGAPEDVLAALAALPARGPGPEAARPLVEVRVRVSRPEPTLRARVEEALAGKEARFARLELQTAGSGEALPEALGGAALRPVSELLPEEVFHAKYAGDFGGAPPDELLADFRALLEAVQAEGA